MLPKNERLTTAEFDTIIASGKVVRNETAHVKFLPSDSKKFAVAAPKKLIKTSVMRHFMKRRIYRSLQECKEVFPNGHYIVFVTKELAATPKDSFVKVLKSLALKVASYR
ncbi:ribonuclease P protein component [Candidatus Woesebacteria bacterium]|nr:ribonuclease P protein component [Candidatus Woesebacteria bacterium]